MMDIAVYTESLRAWPRQMEYAAALAAMFDAHLTGLCVCPPPEISLPSFEVPGYAVEWAEQAQELMDEAVKADAGFVDEARQRHVDKASWQVAQGYVPECLGLASNWHDVLVLGLDRATVWGTPGAIGDIMLSCDLPCLIVPASYSASFSLGSIAVAWNGSLTALRAIHAALPLLTRAQRIVLLQSAPLPSPMDRWRPQFDLQRYLRQHGLLAQSQTIAEYGNGIGDDLLQAANMARADLLVMGGYGHTRLRERILGGATWDVLERANLPIWMQH